MPVELTVLSGAREGEVIRLDSESFRLGDDAAAALRFDPRRDPAGRGRLALVVCEETGWRIQNQGTGSLLVNHTVVEGRAPLRSGDIIRLSSMGPDVRFSLVSAARVGELPSAGAVPSAHEAHAADLTPTGGGESAWQSSVRLRWWPVAAAALGLLVIAVGLAVLSRAPDEPSPPSGQSPAPAAPAVKVEEAPERPVPGAEGDEVAPRSPAPGVPASSRSDNVAGTPSAANVPALVPPPDPWQSAVGAVSPAVCLLVVETPDNSKSFPCGTACAIREDALLTNGMLAAELQNKRAKGWRVKAIWPDEGLELPVREILVHKGFNETVDVREEQIYFELALVLLDGKCKTQATLAEPNELGEIEAGVSLACIGIPHRGLPRTRFDVSRVAQSMTEVYLLTPLAGPASVPSRVAPVLLHLTGRLPQNIFGSPLVNAAGHVVGVYAEQADLPENDARAGLELHYAPLVTLARGWLAGKALDDWIEPTCPQNETPTPSRP